MLTNTDINKLQTIIINYRLEKIEQKAYQAWKDNQTGAILPKFLDKDFKQYFNDYLGRIIAENRYWDVWESLQTIS